MEAWRWLRQREARPPRRSPRRRLSPGTIISLALILGVAGAGIFEGVRQDRAASTRLATLKDGDYAAIDVRELAANPDAYNQRPIQLRGEVVRIEKPSALTYVLLSVTTRDGAQRWEVFVKYGGALPGIVPRATITVFGVGTGRRGKRTHGPAAARTYSSGRTASCRSHSAGRPARHLRLANAIDTVVPLLLFGGRRAEPPPPPRPRSRTIA